MTLITQIQNQLFVLHPCGAVFWEAQNMLLISDVHIGKVVHFRKHGIAIPKEAIHANFERLADVVAFFNPKKIVFLGDLFHSKINNEWHLFEDWVRSVDAEIILVEGNHDIIARENYTDLNIEIFREFEIDNFLLTHHPKEMEGFFNFCGHIHPGIKLYGIGKQAIKLSCFFHRQNQMILPAFGEFTGNYYLKPTEADKVYAITKEEVVFVNLV